MMAGRLCTWLAALLLLLVTAGCARRAEAPEVGSETNWISCESNDDCRDGARCECGVCTKRCGTSEECGAMGDGVACLEATAVSAGGCRIGFGGPTQGICVPGCDRSDDCGEALQCVSGVCVPREAVTPGGKVEDLPVVDGQATIPTQPPTAGASAAGDGAGSGAGQGGRASSSGAAGTAGASNAGSGSTDGGRLTRGTIDDSGYEHPQPKPQCPCTSDLGDDDIAPRVGEVDGNAYGLPAPPLLPTPVASAQMSPLECPMGGFIGGLWPVQFPLESDCTLYAMCPNSCTGDPDCPAGGSGSALPRCAGTGICYLDCGSERSCPDGMACVRGTDGAACYWPRDVLVPGCKGYCESRPRPRDCDNWCADRLVACDEPKDVSCCEGLVCTQEGFCDVP